MNQKPKSKTDHNAENHNGSLVRGRLNSGKETFGSSRMSRMVENIQSCANKAVIKKERHA